MVLGKKRFLSNEERIYEVHIMIVQLIVQVMLVYNIDSSIKDRRSKVGVSNTEENQGVDCFVGCWIWLKNTQ